MVLGLLKELLTTEIYGQVVNAIEIARNIKRKKLSK